MKTLYDVYKDGPDAIVDQGAAQPMNGMVVLRGITDAVLNEGSSIVLSSAGGMSDVRRAVAYEVVSCEEGSPVEPGMHCMTATAAAMPLADNGQCRHVLCHEDDIVLKWWPDDVEIPEEEEDLELGIDAVRSLLGEPSPEGD